MRAAVMIAALALGGCMHTSDGVGTVAKGTCGLPGVAAPEYAVRGKTDYDQRWVNRTTEGLVRGCGNPRPKARPPEWDSVRTVRAATVPSPFAPDFNNVPAKRGWRDRVRGMLGS